MLPTVSIKKASHPWVISVSIGLAQLFLLFVLQITTFALGEHFGASFAESPFGMVLAIVLRALSLPMFEVVNHFPLLLGQLAQSTSGMVMLSAANAIVWAMVALVIVQANQKRKSLND